MPRITLADIRQSDFPEECGQCAGNLPQIAALVNRAQSRLMEAGGETGWWGSWVKVAFEVDPATPYITLPRAFCRIINMDVCREPVRIHNEFYEVLPGGVGLKGPFNVPDWCGCNIAGYERTGSPTMVDTEKGRYVRVYPTNAADAGKTMLITALDQNDLPIYAADGSTGFYLTLAMPFAQSTFLVNSISAVQKDVTAGDVLMKSVDPVSGAEVSLSRYAPTEVNPLYRRYYITRLPMTCQCATTGTVTVTAMCKYECWPIYLDTDQCIIQSLEALIEEGKAIRLSKMETSEALKESEFHHAKAIKILQNQLRHYMGEQEPAVTVNRFGNNRHSLHRQMIGNMI